MGLPQATAPGALRGTSCGEPRWPSDCGHPRGYTDFGNLPPPTYYLPFSDVDWTLLEPVEGTSFCEFKGTASYADIVIGDERIRQAVWWYENPSAGFSELKDFLSLYPGRLESCTLDGEVVQAQEGDFYGGWITSRIVGPFKGAPGTLGW